MVFFLTYSNPGFVRILIFNFFFLILKYFRLNVNRFYLTDIRQSWPFLQFPPSSSSWSFLEFPANKTDSINCQSLADRCSAPANSAISFSDFSPLHCVKRVGLIAQTLTDCQYLRFYRLLPFTALSSSPWIREFPSSRTSSKSPLFSVSPSFASSSLVRWLLASCITTPTPTTIPTTLTPLLLYTITRSLPLLRILTPPLLLARMGKPILR